MRLLRDHRLQRGDHPAAAAGRYYQCSDTECGKLFEDAEGKVEITDKDTLVIPALGHLYNENLECTREGCDYVNPVLALIKEKAGDNFTVTSSTTQLWQATGTDGKTLEANGADTAVFSLTAVKDGTLTVRASILGMMQPKLTITSGTETKATLYSTNTSSAQTVTSDAIEVKAGETLTFTYSNDYSYAKPADYYVRITGLTFEPKTTEPVLEGYTVDVAAGQTEEITVGSDATVNLTVGHKDASVTAFNAYHFVLTYDAAVLTYKGVNLADAQVKDDNGTLTILGYGADNALTTPLTVTFTGKAVGTGAVTLTAANIDQKSNAHTQDAPAAEILTKSAEITVTATYNVKLPDGFTGESTVKHGDSYTFTADDTNYSYDFSGSTMGGGDVTIKDNGDGTYTIEGVTGDLDIQVKKTGKTFNVTVKSTTGAEADVTAAANATYMTDYTFTVTENGSYTYTVSATVGGAACGLTKNNGTYTIAGAKITGDIEITVERTLKPSNVTAVEFTGDGKDDVVNGTTQTAEINKDFTFTIDKKDGYKYTVKLADGSEITANADGSYTIPAASVTADKLVVTVEKEGVATVEVTEYVQADGQSVFLVLATGTPVEGKVFAYDGNAMYHSDKYNADNGGAYVYLLFSDKGLDAVKAEAETKVAEKTGKIAGEIDYSGDVNGTDKIDVNDAQLVWNMYNAQYSDFTSGATMEMFLRADVNGSKNVNTLDAAAVVDLIP